MLHPDFTNPIYPAQNALLSAKDLLACFVDPEHQIRGLSRFSDLHLKVGHPATFRYDGELYPVPGGVPLTGDIIMALLAPMLREDHLATLKAETPSDIDLSWEWAERGVAFRLNVFWDRDGIAAVVRGLPANIPAVSEIGFPDDSIWREVCGLHQGLVLLVGNTGSGKSTTIAALANYINQTQRSRVISLEDPIEYVFKSELSLFSQRELGTHIHSFAAGLRSALREDPDIVFVGEMRDPETVALAMTAAETGHLVFSTLHTRDTRGAITRIIDMFPAERTKEVSTQLSMSLAFVISQKLVRNTKGGRTVAMEVLKNTPSVANLIRTGAIQQLSTQLEIQAKEGMITLEGHLRALLLSGTISITEAMENANDQNALINLLNSSTK